MIGAYHRHRTINSIDTDAPRSDPQVQPVGADVEVTNLGSSSGMPTCRIEVNSPNRPVTGAWTQEVDTPFASK